MIKFALGTAFGIVISTIGMTGMAVLGDHAVNEFKQQLIQASEQAKND